MKRCWAAQFDAGIFIGGMDGVEEEFYLFRRMHPSAHLLPIASIGAAAAILYDQEMVRHRFPRSLRSDRLSSETASHM